MSSQRRSFHPPRTFLAITSVSPKPQESPQMRTSSRKESSELSLYVMFASKMLLVALAFLHLS